MPTPVRLPLTQQYTKAANNPGQIRVSPHRLHLWSNVPDSTALIPTLPHYVKDAISLPAHVVDLICLIEVSQ